MILHMIEVILQQHFYQLHEILHLLQNFPFPPAINFPCVCILLSDVCHLRNPAGASRQTHWCWKGANFIEGHSSNVLWYNNFHSETKETEILNTQMMKTSCNNFFLYPHGKCGMIKLTCEKSKLSMPRGCPFPPSTLSTRSQNSHHLGAAPQVKKFRVCSTAPVGKSLTSQVKSNTSQT